MHLSSLLLPLSLFSTAIAHITWVTPTAANYHATAYSKYTFTFLTSASLDTAGDFSAVFGIRSILVPWEPTALGFPFYNVDLVALGKQATGHGNFSISIPLPASNFYAGDGTYALTSVVTSAFGAESYAALEVFNVTLTVTT